MQHRKLTAADQTAAGRELFRLACVSCHSIGGPRNDVLQLSGDRHPAALMRLIRDMGGEDLAQMPPFAGTRAEAWALARYLVELRQEKGRASP